MNGFHRKVVVAFTSMTDDKLTGTLVCETRQAKRLVFVEEGQLVGCRSDVSAERFGRLLVTHGFLTEAQLDTAVSYIRSGKKLGEIMVLLGYFSAAELSRFVRMQLRNVASAMLFAEPLRIDYTEHIEFTPATDNPVDFTEVFLHAASELDKVDTYREHFDTADSIILPKLQVAPWYDRLAPDQAAVWDVINGQRTMGSIVRTSGLPEEMVLRALIGFQEASAIEIERRGDPAGTSDHATKSRPHVDLRDRREFRSQRVGGRNQNIHEYTSRVGTEPAAEATAEQPALADPPTPPLDAGSPSLPPGPPGNAFLEELRRHKNIAIHGTHWDVLGVAPGCEKPAIFHAFYELSSRFHPDLRRRSSGPKSETELDFVYLRIHEAFVVLSEEASAKSYSQLVEKEAQYEQERRAWAIQPVQAQPVSKDRAESRRLFAMAAQAYDDGDYWETVRLCRLAVDNGENEAEHYFLLGKALSHNPRWRDDAVDNFKIASKLESWNTKYLIALGKLYRCQGLEQRAEEAFLTATIIDPNVQIPLAEIADRNSGATVATTAMRD